MRIALDDLAGLRAGNFRMELGRCQGGKLLPGPGIVRYEVRERLRAARRLRKFRLGFQRRA
ncbi:MAG TPA: hypothetical protein VHI54_03035 [Actinomycetota bacterium]|nr:hypothetical protein [Actinomycetota bacterium]